MIPWLDPRFPPRFPPPQQALPEPNGLLAAGGIGTGAGLAAVLAAGWVLLL